MAPKSLREVYDDCIAKAETIMPLEIEHGKLYRWKGIITSFLISKIDIQCFPYFGFILRDPDFSIPCIVVNPIRSSSRLVKLYKNCVLINEPEFVVEVFKKKTKEFRLVHLFLNIDKLKVIEEHSKVHQTVIELSTDFSEETNDLSLMFVPLKISPVILSPESVVICLVLINVVSTGITMWILLKNEEVIWKEFLILNQIFTIRYPFQLGKDYFKKTYSLHSFFNNGWDISFQQILHHKDFIQTKLYVNLPQNSKLFLSNKSISTQSNAESWFSICDRRLQFVNFASVYGIVTDIRFIKAWKSSSCSWCNNKIDLLEQTMSEEVLNVNIEDRITGNNYETWDLNSSNIAATTGIENFGFPKVNLNKLHGAKISGFGLRGGKITVQVTMQLNYSDQVSHIFLKKWISSQYPAGLIPGVTVCFSDVAVRKSKKKFNYFISTPFTNIYFLESSSVPEYSKMWGPFAFPFYPKLSNKIWGILELDLLTKASITAKCKLCDSIFIQYRCSNYLCSNSESRIKRSDSDYTVVAVARLCVRTSQDLTYSLFLKNDNVQKYLKIPERIWRKLCSLSALHELLYLYQVNGEDDQVNVFNAFFIWYCKYYRQKGRFHVCCKKFKDSEDRFFCTEITEITSPELCATRNAIKSQNSLKNTGQY